MRLTPCAAGFIKILLPSVTTLVRHDLRLIPRVFHRRKVERPETRP